MDIKIGAKLHNRFDIEVKDVTTGEIVQRAQAENIVLDGGINCICSNSVANAIGVRMYFGKGTGTLSPSRTTLFDPIGYKTTTEVEYVENAPPTASYKKSSIVLLPEEFVGETITEVGLANNGTILQTHALLEDSEGNPISIGPKTDTQEITIYSTVFADITLPVGVNLGGFYNTNLLVGLMVGKTQPSTMNFGTSHRILANQEKFKNRGMHYTTLSYTVNLGYVASASTSVLSPSTKQISTPRIRFGTSVGNGKIWSLIWEYESTSDFPILFMPIKEMSDWSGYSLADVAIGTGDGSTTEFDLPFDDFVPDTDVIKVDGVTKTRGTDYTIGLLKNNTVVEDTSLLTDIQTSESTGWTLQQLLQRFLGSDAYNFTVSSLPYYITLDFGNIGIRGFSEIDYRSSTSSSRITSFTLQRSVDGITWDDISTFSPTTSTSAQTFSFTELTNAFRYIRVKVNSVATAGSFRYTNFKLRVKTPQLKFSTAPATGLPITGSCNVEYIPKDSNHVLDVTIGIQFGSV